MVAVLCTTFASAATTRRRPRLLRMQATAFAQDSKPTASGTVPHRGIVAADPAVLPFGSRVRVNGAGPYNGVYIVTDSGARIDGHEIDIYMPSVAEAKRFGKKMVSVQVLEIGAGKQDAREKSIPAKKAR
jgi:3D (Asp-Asp-Asp) domain-containing protein